MKINFKTWAIILFAGIIVSMSADQIETIVKQYARVSSPEDLEEFAAQTLSSSSDTLDQFIQRLEFNYNVLAHFEKTSAINDTTTIDIDGSNFDISEDLWEDVTTVELNGSNADGTWTINNDSDLTYYNYRFRFTTDTTATINTAIKFSRD